MEVENVRMQVLSLVRLSLPGGVRLIRAFLACLLGVTVGFILTMLSGIVGQPSAGSIFVLVRSAGGDMAAMSWVLWFAGGFFLGLALKWPYSLFAAMSELGSLPIVAVIEMVRDPTSHNLWPFEFFFYIVLTIIPLLGMSLALLLKRGFRDRSGSPGSGPGS